MNNHAISAYFYATMLIDSSVPIPLVCQFDNRSLREVYPRAGFNLHPSFVVSHYHKSAEKESDLRLEPYKSPTLTTELPAVWNRL